MLVPPWKPNISTSKDISNIFFKLSKATCCLEVLETNKEQGSSLQEHNGTATNDEHNDSDEPRIHEEYDDTDEPTIY